MSFYVRQNSKGNGSVMQSSSSSRQHEGVQGVNHSNNVPQIYSAIYSTVDVYEMEVGGIAVMRRRKDSWLNATQILKVAGIEKGKRTKVLEKEILIGEHEKVQGGYGKYQGTWVKFERGLEFCKQYGVEELLRPLLTYDMGQDGSVAGGGVVDTPTKEQAMAAQRKRLYNSNVEGRPNSQTGTILKNIISTASHAVAAINKARYDSPGPRRRNSNVLRIRNFANQTSQQQVNSEESSLHTSNTGFEEGNISFNSSENMISTQDVQSDPNSFAQPNRDDLNSDFGEPPRKRKRNLSNVNNSQSSFQDENIGITMRDITPNETGESLGQHSEQDQHMNSLIMPLPPLQVPLNSQLTEKKDLLISLFTNYTEKDFSQHKALESLNPEDLDIPIDASSNTALIWAATLARVKLLKSLVTRGASIFRVNSAGETALMRSCLVTNNLEASSFVSLLELLGPTIEIRDLKGRTVLHHIAIASAVKGRSQASKYYLESLLEFVVRGSGTNFLQSSTTDNRKIVSSIGIGRFMSEIVNVQDSSGDTALMIASRIGNRSIISQLIEVGADASISNRSNLTPADFGVGAGTDLDVRSSDRAQGITSGPDPKESSKSIISSMTSLLMDTLSEFNTEMSKKQAIIDDLHSKLRAECAVLGQRRQKFEKLQAEQHEADTRNFKINNLKRAFDEEKSKLLHLNQQFDDEDAKNLYELGYADKFFKLSEEASNALSKIISKQDKLPMMNSDKHKKPASLLPPISELRARVNAYEAINKSLEKSVQDLKSKDSEVIRKYRKIVSLCAGIDENRVDDRISSLVRSLESEHDDVELGRVQKFLSRVEAV